MTGSRFLLLVPVLLLLGALRGLLEPGEGSRPVVDEERVDRAAACADEDCGCPHEAVASDCCCAPERPEPRHAARIAAAPPPRTATAFREANPFAETDARPLTITSLHCSGGRSRPSSSVGSPPPVAPPRLLAALWHPPADEWRSARVHPPVFDLRREPVTPPPRKGARA